MAGAAARRLDEVAANATVAPATRLVDGWLAKAAPELPFRRANAVLPPLGAADHPDRASRTLDALEAWYTSMGRRLLVQVSSADPEAHVLDALLAARGMSVEAPVDVLVATAGAIARRDDTVEVAGVDVDRCAAAAAVHGEDAAARERVEAYGRMLSGPGSDAVLAVARAGGVPVGVGFGVVEDGWLGVFGMGTAVAHRRRGIARSVLGALAGEAVRRAVPDLYLQVELDAPAAQALYRGCGFTPSHRYHYRATSPV